ncbi:MAG: hypothetical protein MI892_12115 [Desulfobacterales bacterium]|nr:hypothetical protein [Desulfobacterales bacterium]
MTEEQTKERHLSRDELFDILNEIDAERQSQHTEINTHLNDKNTGQVRPVQRDLPYKN